MKLNRQRRAFSLVELLVVIGIIGVLFGMLMPAIQMARESARGNDCRNRIRQGVLGMMNSSNSRGRYANTKEALNPYVENQAAGYFSICPSSGASATEINPFSGMELSTSNYFLVYSGTAEFEEPDGTFPTGTINGFFPAGDVKLCYDGLSNTVCFSEALFDLRKTSSSGDDVVDHWSGLYGETSHVAGSTGVPVNGIKRDWIPFEKVEIGFSSNHPVGINAGFVDGHVETITESIDADAWSAIGTQALGEPIYDWSQ